MHQRHTRIPHTNEFWNFKLQCSMEDRRRPGPYRATASRRHHGGVVASLRAEAELPIQQGGEAAQLPPELNCIPHGVFGGRRLDFDGSEASRRRCSGCSDRRKKGIKGSSWADRHGPIS